MFGYFRPYDADLTANQLKTFRAYYCRLCCGLRSMGGQRARYLTTFDATLYYMIYNMAVGASTPAYFRCQKLSKKSMRLVEKDELAMRFVHGVLVAIGVKMHDDRLDGDKTRARLIKLLFGRAIKAAENAEPEMTEASFAGTAEINRMQEENADIDRLLSAYGNVLADALLCVGEVDERYAELYKSIAAWTFYVDILCDYDEDFRKKQFNPLLRDDKPTLKELFDCEYPYLMGLNRAVCGRVMTALTAVKDGSAEWQTLHNILTHALSTVVPNMLEGKNVKFRYFKELTKNLKIMKKSRRRFDEADRLIKGQNKNDG